MAIADVKKVLEGRSGVLNAGDLEISKLSSERNRMVVIEYIANAKLMRAENSVCEFSHHLTIYCLFLFFYFNSVFLFCLSAIFWRRLAWLFFVLGALLLFSWCFIVLSLLLLFLLSIAFSFVIAFLLVINF